MTFLHFWSRGIWRFHFLVVYEDPVFSVIWGCGWYLGIPIAALTPFFTLSCPLEVEIDYWWRITNIHLLCFLTVRANNAPVRATVGVASVKLWNFSVALAGVGGGNTTAPCFRRFSEPGPCQNKGWWSAEYLLYRGYQTRCAHDAHALFQLGSQNVHDMHVRLCFACAMSFVMFPGWQACNLSYFGCPSP